MADLGSIGFFFGQFKTQDGFVAATPIVTALPSSVSIPKAENVLMTRPSMLLAGSDGLDYLCEGIVSVLGTPTAGYLVRAYRRDNGALLGEDVSVAGGVFSITINGYDGEVTCIAYDDTGSAPDYNAIVFDRVVPLLA